LNAYPYLFAKLNSLNLALSGNDVPVIRSFLQQLVTGHQPSGEVVKWIYLVQERQSAVFLNENNVKKVEIEAYQ
jgi:hypothetical protein